MAPKFTNGISRENRYFSDEDFRDLFAGEMPRLFQLALLLTADPHLAEECFLSGLEDCVRSNSVFQEWAHNWARRVIIRNAIRIVKNSASRGTTPLAVDPAAVHPYTQPGVGNPHLSAILSLPVVERFVFVLTTLEGYSSRQTEILLARSSREVQEAKEGAVRRLWLLEASVRSVPASNDNNPQVLNDPRLQNELHTQ